MEKPHRQTQAGRKKKKRLALTRFSLGNSVKKKLDQYIGPILKKQQLIFIFTVVLLDCRVVLLSVLASTRTPGLRVSDKEPIVNLV